MRIFGPQRLDGRASGRKPDGPEAASRIVHLKSALDIGNRRQYLAGTPPAFLKTHLPLPVIFLVGTLLAHWLSSRLKKPDHTANGESVY